MSNIERKLQIMDLEAELAAATTPASRAALQKKLDGHRAALAAAQERGSASRAARERGSASRAASRAASRVVVTTDDEPGEQKCDACGEENDADAKFCDACGEELGDDDDADAEPSPEAVQGAIDRAVYGYAALKNATPLKPGDLSAFQRSMQMRAGVQRTADAVRVRAQIDARAKR